MILNNIPELRMVGVEAAGVPNYERIVIIANTSINLGNIGLMIGVYQETGFAFPIRDNLFWFGDGIMNQGDFLNVYTGPGSPRTAELPNTSGKMFTLHWGRKQTIFDNPDITPILFRADAVNVFRPTLALPRGSGQKET